MGENSNIQWTDHTFNPWRGCTKVSAECDHCYAETLSGRNPKTLGVWGKYGTRVVASENYWKEAFRWNADARYSLERRKVFCASLADVFESGSTMPEFADIAVLDARNRLFEVIDSTPDLDWLLLTKRPESIQSLWPFGWYDDQFTWPNIWLGTSVGVQKTKHRIDTLRQYEQAKIRFLSCEPLLEDLGDLDLTGIDWVIVGGESGGRKRPFNADWARSIRDQCKEQGVAFFMKQVDKVQPIPDDLMIREFPTGELATT